MQCEDVTRKPS